MAISVRQARKILGEEAEILSDEDIRSILRILTIFAEELLDMQEKGEL